MGMALCVPLCTALLSSCDGSVGSVVPSEDELDKTGVRPNPIPTLPGPADPRFPFIPFRDPLSGEIIDLAHPPSPPDYDKLLFPDRPPAECFHRPIPDMFVNQCERWERTRTIVSCERNVRLDPRTRKMVGVFSNCRLSPGIFLYAIVDPVDKKKVETTFQLSYEVFGKTDKLQFFLQSGATTKMLVEKVPTSEQITGPDDLTLYDADPDYTASARLSYPCTMTILSSSRSVSANTILRWRLEASNQAKILDLSLRYYLLLKQFSAITSWQHPQLEDLRDTLAERLAQETNPVIRQEYSDALETINSVLNGPDSSMTSPTIAADLRKLLQTERDYLIAEHSKTELMLARFVDILQETNNELQAAITRITNGLR